MRVAGLLKINSVFWKQCKEWTINPCFMHGSLAVSKWTFIPDFEHSNPHQCRVIFLVLFVPLVNWLYRSRLLREWSDCEGVCPLALSAMKVKLRAYSKCPNVVVSQG